MPGSKFIPKHLRDEAKRPIVNLEATLRTSPDKILQDILKCGFANLATAFLNGGGGGGFSCAQVADCIINDVDVQNALTDFIETNDFKTTGTWSFGGPVVFNNTVDFYTGPVNFWGVTLNYNNTTSNYTNSDIVLDVNSLFTNNGDTVLNGTTTIDNLIVNNITLGGGINLGDFISADGGNIIVLGTDGGLYAPSTGGGFTCSDVADCIDNDATVQEALSNWFIDALSTDTDLTNALEVWTENFIENGSFNLLGNWDFQGGITINGSPVGAAVVTGATENFVGTGAQVAFVLANPPADPDMVWVSGNGVFDQDGALLDYTITGQTVTFNTAPTNGYKIQIKYIRNFGSVLNLWKEEVPTGTVNSINTVFTLTQTPIPSSTSVYINGLRQRVTTDYTITGTTLTFVVAPTTGATLDVHYMY